MTLTSTVRLKQRQWSPNPQVPNVPYESTGLHLIQIHQYVLKTSSKGRIFQLKSNFPGMTRNAATLAKFRVEPALLIVCET